MKCISFISLILLFHFGDSSPLSCPDPDDIAPCSCSGNSITCDGDMTQTDIETVFQATFPVQDLDTFVLSNNKILTELDSSVFCTVTFQAIDVHYDENLSQISDSFFVGQENTLRNVSIHNTQLSSDGFPYSSLSLLTYLTYLDLSSNSISSIPVPIPSNSLITLRYEGNVIESIEDDTFSNSQNLANLYLSNNSIAAVGTGNYFKLKVL